MAILIPEQVSALIKERKALLNRLLQISDHADFSSLSSIEKYVDNINYEEIVHIFRRTKEINDKLTESSFLKKFDFDSVNIGTKFIVEFDDSSKEQVTMVEEKLGVISNSDVVSVDSPLGREILNKHENDSFSYNVEESPVEIKGKVVSIIKDPEMYLKYLRNDDVYIFEDEITSSQRDLLLMEKSRLRNSGTNASRVEFIDALLDEAVIRESAGSKIGIGTKFKIEFFDNINNDNEYELIKRAVTDELENSYIEKNSPLGKEIFGLSDNETFSLETENGKVNGKVYSLK